MDGFLKINFLEKICAIGLIAIFVFILIPDTVSASDSADPSLWQIYSTEVAGNVDRVADGVGGIAADIANAIVDTVVRFAVNLMMYIASWILWLAGVLLNFSMQFSVVDMKANLDNLGGITNAWKIFRDIANFSFIFILLYTAIATILQIGVDTKKTIVNVIVIALLINFSMFFTRVVIDASNVATIGFHKAMSSYCPVQQGMVDRADGCISKIFANALRVNSIYEIDTRQGGNSGNFFSANANSAVSRLLNNNSRVMIMGIMGTLVLMLTAFLLLVVSFLLIFRFITFALLIILSPVAFAAYALPNTKKYFDQWFHKLIDQALWAPAYFLMLFITMKVIIDDEGGNALDVITRLEGNASFAEMITGNMGTALGLVTNYVIIMALLVSALTISKKLGASGAKMATTAAGKLSFGTAAFAGRNTVGRAGNFIANSERMKNMKAEGGLKGLFATGVIASANKGAKSSFDVRTTDMAKTALGSDLGKTKTGGYKKDMEDRLKGRTESAKALETSADKIREAEQELEFAKSARGQEKGESIKANKLSDIDSQIDKLRKQRDRTTGAERQAEIDEKINTLQKDRAKAEKYNIITEAQNKVDSLKGVDTEELYKRLKKEGYDGEKDDDKMKAWIEEKKDNIINFDQKGLRLVESAGKTRQLKYASNIENATILTRNMNKNSRVGRFAQGVESRVVSFISGHSRSERRAQGSKVRKEAKGKESVKDLLDKALEQTGEKPKTSSGETKPDNKPSGEDKKPTE